MENVLGHCYVPRPGGAAQVQPGASGTVAINGQAELIVQLDARDASGNLQTLSVVVQNGQARLVVQDPDVIRLLELVLAECQSTNDRLQAFLDNQTRYMEKSSQ